MNRVFYRLILVAIACAARFTFAGDAPTSKPSAPLAQAYQLFTDPAGHFTVSVPSAWSCKLYPAKSQMKLSAKPVAEGATSVTIGVSLRALSTEEEKAGTDQELQSAKSKGGKVLSDDSITLDQLPCREVVYTTRPDQDEGVRKELEIVAIKDGKTYHLLFNGEPALFDKYRADVDELVKSFKWTDQPN